MGGDRVRQTEGLQRAATLEPRHTGTSYQGRKRSYGEILARVVRFAGGLRSLGAKPGDRIAIIALNSDRYFEAYYAALWAGCAVVPGNTRWAPAEHAYALNDSDCSLLLADRTFFAMSQKMAAETGAPVVLIDDDDAVPGALSQDALIARSEPIPDSSGSGKDMLGIFYTGGTTGWPKGVMLSHAGMIVNFMSAAMVSQYPQRSVFLHSPPMFHLADATVIFGLTPYAATHVIVPGFDPPNIVKTIVDEQVNAAVFVPTMLNMLNQYLEANPADLSCVQRVTYGASAISDAVLRRSMANFPNAAFAQAYGQTELSPVATILEPRFHVTEGEGAKLLRSAGRPVPNVEIRIVGPDMETLAAGEVGEVGVRGENVMLGYWNKPELTAQTIIDGWLRTGDAGYLDSEGFLFLVDRVKDMIVSGGENVYSAEVENALARHPAVVECAVIGVPDEKWGERVHAIVRLRPGSDISEPDLSAHCRDLIAGYKQPRSYEFRADPLPLSGAGKILKTELRKPHWAGHDRSVA